MAQDCPNCGLANPRAAQRCDCGYDFSTRMLKESYLVSRASGGRSPHADTRTKTRGFECDLAYGCFLIWGLTVLSVSVMRASYTNAEWAGGAGALLILFLPLLLASFMALLVAIVLSVRLWRQPTLRWLTGMTFLLIPTLFITYGSTAFHTAVGIAYGVGVTGMCGLWFLALRRRHRPAALFGARD